jgi:predicted MPP superfamily phosphohydrolase
MKTTRYQLFTDKKGINIKLAVVSDLHARPYKSVLDAVKTMNPDAILLPGDIVEIATEYMDDRNKNGLDFLREAASVAPTYYCYGNHEIYYSHAKSGKSKTPDKRLSADYLERIRAFGVHVINDALEIIVAPSKISDGLTVGGLVCGRDMDPSLNMNDPDLDFLTSYGKESGFKILLCHYPHYFEKYLKNTDFDLVLSGHAHGGQIRLPSIGGIIAPEQGLFPEYDAGVFSENNTTMVVSRGLGNSIVPVRINNSPEVVVVTFSY